MYIDLMERTWLRARSSPTIGASSAFVQVGRQDAHLGATDQIGWARGMGELQVYESWLTLRAHLTGLR